jgi:hypothetical protein
VIVSTPVSISTIDLVQGYLLPRDLAGEAKSVPGTSVKSLVSKWVVYTHDVLGSLLFNLLLRHPFLSELVRT